MMRRLVLAFSLLGALLLTACLPFPLGDPEKSKVDPSLAGFWKAQNDEDVIVALIAPFDGKAYVIDYSEYDKDDTIKHQLVSKAWLTELAGQRFLTVNPIHQLLPPSADEERKYIVFHLNIAAGSFKAKAVKNDFAEFKEVKTVEQMTEVIRKNATNAELYGDELTFTKLDPEKDKETIAKYKKRM